MVQRPGRLSNLHATIGSSHGGAHMQALWCWKCGASLEGVLLPFARLAECPACRTDLHVCRMCGFYDTGSAHACREPVADEVQDKTRSNFCGYFQASDQAYGGGNKAALAARAQLEGLFGGVSAGETRGEGDAARERLEGFFGGGKNNKQE